MSDSLLTLMAFRIRPFNSTFRQQINGYTESVCKFDDCWLTQL